MHLNSIMLLIRENKQLKDGKIILFPDSQIDIQQNFPVPGIIRYSIQETELPSFESKSFPLEELYDLKTVCIQLLLPYYITYNYNKNSPF